MNKHNPHHLDKYGQYLLLEIAESAQPPEVIEVDSVSWTGVEVMSAADGWKVGFFYDCGELDYIDHFVTPDGKRLEVWVDEYDSEFWPPVMNWRGVGDLKRIKDIRQI